MTYKSNFVVCVKVNGKVMRDSGEEVYIPFGSEYSLLLKNLESRKAVALVTIDGTPMSHKVIVPAQGEVELERFIEEDLDRGYRFKFIEKTDEISEYRGDKPCDGLITIEYWFEKKHEPLPIYDPIYIRREPRAWPTWEPIFYSTGSSSFGDKSFASNSTLRCAKSSVSTMSCFTMSDVSYDDGITVKGEDSNQSFRFGQVNDLEYESHTITLKLKGFNKGKEKVAVPVFVSTRLICPSCGKSHKSNVRFCGGCGTRLV